MAHITIKSSITPIYDIINDKIIKIETLKPIDLANKVKIFVNGTWVGITKDPYKLYMFLKDKKYKGIINVYTSIVFDCKNKEIIICNDAGRLMRPVYKVKNNKINISPKIKKIKDKKSVWEDLLVETNDGESILEYIDSREQNSSLIYIPKKRDSNDNISTNNYTHCELHSSTIFGILGSCIPFCEHNQSPRNTYQCAMGKQALGTFATNYHHRMDKTSYVQTYTMRPLVDTRLMNYINLHKVPSGCMVIVAIMTYSGYNQEDSIIFNKDSVDRGLFASTIYHTEKDEEKKIHGDEEIRCKPDKTKTKGMKFANYNKLNHIGIVPKDTLLEDRDIIIGKVAPIKQNRNDHTKIIKYKDQSRVFRCNEECYIDKNYVHRNGDGYTFAKIRTRAFRKANIGDKFSSRHGQKGTIGLIKKQCDMPHTQNGLVPDIIINPMQYLVG